VRASCEAYAGETGGGDGDEQGQGSGDGGGGRGDGANKVKGWQ